MSLQYKINNITIIGGGNIGTQFACVCASKGYNVRVFTSKPEAFEGTLKIFDKNNNNICSGKIKKATEDISEAMENADAVFVTVPASLFNSTAYKMAPYIRRGMYIGIIPGSGGAEFAFKQIIDNGAVLFGLQRVPAVARLIDYGKSVYVEGKRDSLYLGAIPVKSADMLSDFMSNLFDMPCFSLPNYLSVTLTPSNPILHTTRLCSMFSSYKKGVFYKKNPLFYGEWTDASSKLLLDCDDEHQKICSSLDKIDLSYVHSLRCHYKIDTASELTSKLRSIQSLHDLKSPMIKNENGWIPDFSSRYFSADFPYGLKIISEFAKVIGVEVPNINETLQWFYDVSESEQSFNLSDYGINNCDDIYRLYL